MMPRGAPGRGFAATSLSPEGEGQGEGVADAHVIGMRMTPRRRIGCATRINGETASPSSQPCPTHFVCVGIASQSPSMGRRRTATTSLCHSRGTAPRGIRERQQLKDRRRLVFQSRRDVGTSLRALARRTRFKPRSKPRRGVGDARPTDLSCAPSGLPGEVSTLSAG